ncbi:MAG: anaerobic ribonucleoside-triphosphate reductase, partial [Deltaproteobacteria bacterium]|nr:anaerobic ribonucleoside-triphosphate reductase [Deltaproteobacteria bacterium]
GLDLPDWFSVADPAKHAEVLLAHMVRFSAALQGNFSSWVRWDAVNILFAPYLAGMSDNSIKQLAQMLVFEFSQLATARGGQLMMSSMDIYWDLPVHLRDCRAIGPGGVETGRKYSHYLPDARRFACAVLEVFKEGDARGRPFFFPIPLVHLTRQVFLPENRGFLLQGCEAAARTGNPHFIFDRERHSTLPGGKAASGTEPWKMRIALIQNVTINLARAGFHAAKSDAKLFTAIDSLMETAALAHAEKADFMNKLLGEEQGPLSFLTINRDGEPYLKMKDAGYGAVEFCSRVLKFIRKKTDVLSKKHGLRILPGHTPAESAAYKFARLDLKKFAPESARFIRGNLARGGVYYSGSACLPSAHGLDPGEQARIEGIFHKLVSGVYSRIRLNGESPGEIADILTRAFLDTGNLQMTFAPVFTSCLTCRMTFTGHFTECPRCSAGEIEIISKITGYFARSSSLNQGKLAELEDLRKKLP